MAEFTDIEIKSDGSLSAQGLIDRVIAQDARIAALEAENSLLTELLANYKLKSNDLLHCLKVILSHAEGDEELDVRLHLDIAQEKVNKYDT